MEDSSSAKRYRRYLPEEVVRSILLRLPVKCLLRFRCVCREWNSLIRNPSFVSDHLVRSNSPANRGKILLVNHSDTAFLLLPSLDPLDRPKQLDFPFSEGLSIVGHCNGIVCVRAGIKGYFLWNPATREYKPFPESSGLSRAILRYDIFGFGFDSNKHDYIAVRHVYYLDCLERKARLVVRSQLYSLKMDSWREIQRLPNFIVLSSVHSGCGIDGAICWIGYDARNNHKTVVVLFSTADEAFQFVTPPGKGGCHTAMNGLLAYTFEECHTITTDVHVWVMNNFRDSRSWVRQFSIELPLPLGIPYGFLDTGELLLLKDDDLLTCVCPITRKVTKLAAGPGIISFISYRESLVSICGKTCSKSL